MVDLTREMASLMAALGSPKGRLGRAIMFVSAYGQEGSSTCAREFARAEAAFAKRPVWLIDADLRGQGQLAQMGKSPDRFGPPGPLSQATPDGSVFYSITPKGHDSSGQIVSDARFLVARSFLGKRLWVTRFRDQNLSAGQKVKICEKTSYWQALRQHAQTIIVDAPALDRGPIALQLAPLMDGVIIVISEDMGRVEQRLLLRDQIERAGGRVLGIFYNRARRSEPHDNKIKPRVSV